MTKARGAVSRTPKTHEIVESGLTVAQVRKPLDNLTDRAKAIGTAKRSADKAVRSLMWDSALFTHNVVTVAKAIGKDKEFPTQGDYAEAIGYAPGYVTALKNLGRAAVVHGIRRDSREWTFLAVNVDKSHAKEIREAIGGDDSDKVKSLLTAALAAAGEPKAVGGKREARNLGGSSGDAGTPGNGGATPATPEGTRPATLDEILSALDKMAKAADREEWAKIESRLATIVEREVRIRAKADQTVKGEVVKSA